MKIVALFAATSALLLSGSAAGQSPEGGDAPVAAHLDARAQAAVAGINRFSVDLYKRSIPDKPENVFVSPASVSTAVGFAYRGAVGATADELRSVLHYDAPPRDYLATDGAILATLNFTGKGRELHVANALWAQEGLPLRPDYVADMAAHAGAGRRRVDFRHDPEAARTAINRWVADATHDRIKDLLQPGNVKDTTRFTLVNSIYWKGRWAEPFEDRATRPELFTELSGRRVTTPLMHQQNHFSAIERDGVKAILLPYEHGEVAMIVLLPGSPSKLPAFERRLTVDRLDTLLKALEAAPSRDTILTLPKMHLGWRADVVPMLQTLGATTPFSEAADFSGIATEPYPGEVPGAKGLAIDQIIHQTYLDVDEKGSEAAAATAVGIIVTSARRAPPPPFVFRADRPFLFLIRDQRTGLILFMGRYVAPPSS